MSTTIDTNIEKLRNAIADPYKYAEDTQIGDNESKLFELSHSHIKDDSYSVYINNVQQVESTHFTIDKNSGVITFIDVPTTSETIRVVYQYSAFTDDELNYYLQETSNNIDKSSLMAIDVLLWDSARRYDYTTGKAEMKPRQVFQNLKDLREILVKKISSNNNTIKRVKRKNSLYDSSSTKIVDISRLGIDDQVWSNNR